jgi:hypothetical protein
MLMHAFRARALNSVKRAHKPCLSTPKATKERCTMEHQDHHSKSGHGQHNGNHYPHLHLMAALSFVAMFVLMYAMVDQLANVFVNLNQAYMAGLMASPMVIMIPHHAGAILMCEQLQADDAEIRRLCSEIIESQNREIAQMKAMLQQLEK